MRDIPGTQPAEGREYCYLRYEDDASFRRGFDRLGRFDSAPLPRSGGIISENAKLATPSGDVFFAVSYKGDLEGWRRLIEAFVQEECIEIGWIEERTLCVGGEARCVVDACQPTFF